MNTEIDSLELKVKTDAQQAASSLNALAESLGKVKTATKGGTGLAAVEKQLSKIKSALDGLDSAKIAGAKTALDGLEGVKAKATATNTKLAESNAKLNKSFSALKFSAVAFAAQRVGRVISKWISESNDYVENLNLFTVAMGEYAEPAQAYAEKVSQLMGIDPSDWMRAQGVFQTLATGFGVAADKAAVMSQNLTQLSYDLASFYNLSVDDAAQKVQSAFSGELEPVRRLGFDLSQARLEAIAAANGIDKAVSSMTQAEKSQLRYYALMTQVTQVHGDMARTLDAPANQIRVFQAAVTQAGRALGNIFIPALNAILPVATAVLQVVRELAEGLAAVFGFRLATVDYSGVETGSGAISDSLDEVADSAGGAKKALDNYALSIDELNTISPNSGGDGSGASELENALANMDIPTYNFLAGLEEKAKNLKDELKEVLETLVLLGGAAALFSLATQLAQAQGIATLLGKIALSTIVVALEFLIAADSIKSYITEKDIWDLIQTAIVVGAGSAILYKMWGPAGAAIGFAVGVIATVTGISMAIAEGADFDSLEVRISQLLAGVFGGLAGLSIAKATGANLGAGALVGISVATALALTVTNASAITSGQIKVDSAESVVHGLLSSAFAGIAGATVIGGPTGFAIGLGVGLVVNIVSALLADQARKNAEEIAKRFGDIALSIEQMEEAATRFVGAGLEKSLEGFVSAKGDVEEVRDRLIEIVDLLDEKIEMDIEPISEDEFNSLIDVVDEYASKRKVMLQFTVDALGVGEEMEQLLLGEGSVASKLAGLGGQLRNVVAEGIKDGEWIPDKYAEAMRIYGEIKEITDMVSQLEFEVNMEIAIGEFKLKDLTPDSVKGFLETATKTIEERVGTLNEAEAAARVELKAQLKMGEIDKAEYEARLAEIEADFRNQRLTMYTNMYLEVSEFVTESHGDLLGKMESALNGTEMQQGLKAAAGAFYSNYNKYFTGPEAEGWAKIGAEEVVNNAKSAIVSAMSSGLSEEEKASMQTLFDAIKPSHEKTMELAKEYYNAGLKIPEELGKALNDSAAIGALTGDVDSMLYNLGAHLSDSPSMVSLLSMVEGAGAKLPNSLVLGISANMDAVNTAVMDGIIPVTQTLVDNFEAAGLKVPAAWLEKLNEGIAVNQERIQSAGQALGDTAATAATAALGEMDYASGVPGAIEVSASAHADALGSSGELVGSYVGKAAQGFLAKEDYSGSITSSINSSVSNASGGLSSAGAAAGATFASSMNAAVASALASVNKIMGSVGDIFGVSTKAVTINGYASGGYPTVGQLFLARESGPEMVGSIGGRTAVANNDQIVEAVAAGVYQAVLSAQGNSDGGGNMQVAVYLDGKQIESSVRSTQQKRGAVIATGGILNYA